MLLNVSITSLKTYQITCAVSDIGEQCDYISFDTGLTWYLKESDGNMNKTVLHQELRERFNRYINSLNL